MIAVLYLRGRCNTSKKFLAYIIHMYFILYFVLAALQVCCLFLCSGRFVRARLNYEGMNTLYVFKCVHVHFHSSWITQSIWFPCLAIPLHAMTFLLSFPTFNNRVCRGHVLFVLADQHRNLVIVSVKSR